jgi:hypothetical protein
LRGPALEAAAAPATHLLSPSFPFLVHALAQCAAMSAARDEEAPVPAAWSLLQEVVASLAKTFFDSGTPVSLRKVAAQRFRDLGLASCFLPEPLLKSKALKEAVMLPLEALSAVPGASSYHWVTHWERRLAWLRKEVFYLRSISAILERSEEVSEKEKSVFARASELMSDFLKFSAMPVTNGMTNVYESQIFQMFRNLFSAVSDRDACKEWLEKIYASDTWCQEIPGFSEWRSEFRFFMVNEAPKFRTGSRAAALISELMDHDPKYFGKNISKLTSLARQLLTNGRRTRVNLKEWEKKKTAGLVSATEDPPAHDEAGTRSLENLIRTIAERASAGNFGTEDSVALAFREFLTSDTLAIIEIAPRDSVKFLEAHPDSDPFRTWVGRVSSILSSHPLSPELEEEFTSEVVGLPALRPLIEKIAREAEAAEFKSEDPKTRVFQTLLEQNINLFFLICQKTAKNYIAKFPYSGAFSCLESTLSHYLGDEAVVVLLESMIDGWFLHFDFTAVGKPQNLPKPRLFKMALKEDEGGNFLQTPESRERRAALQSVDGVAEAFVKLFGHPETAEDVKSVLSHLKITPEEPPKPATSSLLDPFAHVGAHAAALEPCKWSEGFFVEGFVSGKLSDKYAMLNPYLAFRILLTHRKPEAPFQAVSLPPFLFLHYIENVLVTSEPWTTPIKEYDYAVPLRYLLDYASKLLRVFVPHFRESGNHRVAAELSRAVANILSVLHRYTSNCKYNPDRYRYASKNIALDALVLEAAEKIGEEMVVPGFSELLQEVMMSSDSSTLDLALGLAESSWQLKWSCEQ